MSDPIDSAREASAFLSGDVESLASIEEVVRLVVRSFQFRDRDLEGDLAQESLSRILGNLSGGKFRGEASLKTYARTIARYTCLEHIRRRRWEVDLDPEGLRAADRWSAPEESFLWTEEHLRNLQAFATLPAECREILRLVGVEGASYREIAGRLGITEAALKSRIHRCRLACREAASAQQRPGERERKGGR